MRSGKKDDCLVKTIGRFAWRQQSYNESVTARRIIPGISENVSALSILLKLYKFILVAERFVKAGNLKKFRTVQK